MIKKYQKKLRLSQDDLDMLEALKGEFSDTGIAVSDSEIVAMGIRQLKKQGGAIVTLAKQKIVDGLEVQRATAFSPTAPKAKS